VVIRFVSFDCPLDGSRTKLTLPQKCKKKHKEVVQRSKLMVVECSENKEATSQVKHLFVQSVKSINTTENSKFPISG